MSRGRGCGAGMGDFPLKWQPGLQMVILDPAGIRRSLLPFLTPLSVQGGMFLNWTF